MAKAKKVVEKKVVAKAEKPIATKVEKETVEVAPKKVNEAPKEVKESIEVVKLGRGFGIEIKKGESKKYVVLSNYRLRLGKKDAKIHTCVHVNKAYLVELLHGLKRESVL
jgi:hypothetical protein